MARKSSAFEDLIEIAAQLPWWLALVLAVASYLALHSIALMGVPTPNGLQGMGEMVGRQMLKVFATFGQYIVPVAFVFGAIGSVIGQRKRANLYSQVVGRDAKSALDGISWRQFEMLVGEWFRRQGYTVVETGGVADGGVDLVLTRDGETYLVQCKQWKAYKVGVNIVRELLGVMTSRGAAGGFIVTSGVFTQEAKRFASDSNVILIDGTQLFDLIRSTRVSQPSQPAPAPASYKPVAPMCPKCGSDMILRKASRGAQAGQSFWGCPGYPACRGTRPA